MVDGKITNINGLERDEDGKFYIEHGISKKHISKYDGLGIEEKIPVPPISFMKDWNKYLELFNKKENKKSNYRTSRKTSVNNSVNSNNSNNNSSNNSYYSRDSYDEDDFKKGVSMSLKKLNLNSSNNSYDNSNVNSYDNSYDSD